MFAVARASCAWFFANEAIWHTNLVVSKFRFFSARPPRPSASAVNDDGDKLTADAEDAEAAQRFQIRDTTHQLVPASSLTFQLGLWH
jgi:hypothetical protein